MEGRNLDMGNLLSAMEVGMAWGSERGERERETERGEREREGRERERPRERDRERERGHHTARKTQKNNNRTGPNRSVESNAGVPARVSVCVYVEGKAVTHAETTRDDQQLAGTA